MKLVVLKPLQHRNTECIGIYFDNDPKLNEASGTNLFKRRIKQHVFGDIVPRQITAELRLGWGKPGLSPSAAPASK